MIDKGQVKDCEMYSAFYDPFRTEDSGLARILKENKVTDVFVAGLAFDFCVKATAEHACEEGYKTYVIENATKAVFPDKWDDIVKELQEKGVEMISWDGDKLTSGH